MLLDRVECRAFTTDLRIVSRPLRKVICTACGLAANAELRGPAAIADYEESYALNTTAGEEHVYFIGRNPVPRSRAIMEWILPHVGPPPQTLLEVGCGQGNLLSRLRDALPGTEVFGVEASRQAADLAQARGLAVHRGIVAPDAPPLPEADVVVSFGVLEHVDDPTFFLAALHRACRPGGRAVVAFPIQEQGGYDLFFEDHVWHFTLELARATAERAGWRVIAAEADHPIVQGFGLLVCTPEGNGAAAPSAHARALQAANLAAWQARFDVVNSRLAALAEEPLIVFGAGELFGLLYAYTDVGRRPIERLIDDASERPGRSLYGIPIEGREWIAGRPRRPVFVAVNARYHRQLAESLSALGLRLVFWCDAP